jgi:hypothetical protein
MSSGRPPTRVRRALAGVLLFLAVGIFVVDQSYPIDCDETSWVIVLLELVVALLIGSALLALLWRRQSLWWIPALSALAVWIVLFSFFVLRTGGTCAG